MSITLARFDAVQIYVSLSDAMRYMGMTGEDAEISAIAEQLLAELRHVATPKACFGEYPVEREADLIKIGGIISDSAALRKNLDGCDTAMVFAATIGIGVDRLLTAYSKTEPSKAVILSALGSAMIEGVCDELCHTFGGRTKPRFSPGYGGFCLSAQKEIAQLLDTEKNIGLYFTDSMMMIPEKSVTAVVGIYEK